MSIGYRLQVVGARCVNALLFADTSICFDTLCRQQEVSSMTGLASNAGHSGSAACPYKVLSLKRDLEICGGDRQGHSSSSDLGSLCNAN